MSQFAVLAASFMGAEGCGNDLTRLRPWPAPVAEALERGEFEALRWRALFRSEASRFGRMDLLSRLGLMAVELLDASFDTMEPSRRDAVGVCVETRFGCTAADVLFLQTPMAGAFACTLPSTVLGEICIRHRFRGPVLCVLPVSGRGGSLEIATGWLHRGEADACLCVACDLMDKRFAASMLSPHDAPGEAWQSCAVWIGRPTGAGREHPLGSDSLPRLARSLVASGVPARNPGAGVS